MQVKENWGLKQGEKGVIDQDNHIAFHLEAVKTPSKLDNKSLLVIIMKKYLLREKLVCLKYQRI